ncbi:MAG TPA: RNA degradosome polyphosphate kinase, partial [Opitutaceae bacterium]|nr:RNA degradosome polyphosphate kinase [Opitutaceae bacterium]
MSRPVSSVEAPKKTRRRKPSAAAAEPSALEVRPPARMVHAAGAEMDPVSKAAYFNRELSWLAFDRRVLEQAQSERHPLLERVRFLTIVSSNLDEFFEIRVAGLMQQMDSGVTEPGPDGLSPREQLRRVHSVVASLVDDQHRTWHEQLMPALAEQGIYVRTAAELSQAELNWVKAYFREQ